MLPAFPPAEYIDHDKEFRRIVKKLAKETSFAIDTESNSLYAYQERVCLIQISTRSQDYIFDPLRIADLSPLGVLLADPKIEKVFHAAEYDLICLKRDFNISVVNVFDTMLAARILGFKAVGLDKLLALYCGVEANKKHQRDDWGQRPLPEENLHYAQMDTHYLLAVRDHLHAELTERGLLQEAYETFIDACNVPVPASEFDPEGYWRLGIPASLSRREMAILREVYLLRDSLARERDVPSFKVFNDEVLVALAEAAPTYYGDLKNIRGLSAGQVGRYGNALIEAVQRGKNAPSPKPPQRPPDIDPLIVERFSALRDWRRRRAEERGVESDVIVSKHTLWEVARRLPGQVDDLHGIPGLGPWRLATYGEELISVLRRFNGGL